MHARSLTPTSTMHQPNMISVKSVESVESLQFYPFEINGRKYMICKLPNHSFSTLHDPDTKQIVGKWNNELAHYEIFPDLH